MAKVLAQFAQRRVRSHRPLIIGLTGSIAMGKSTAANMLRNLGIPVFDSDASSRALTAANGKALPAIAQKFPDVFSGAVLDRQALAKRVFGNVRDLAALEAIIHPLVRAARKNFIRHAARHHRRCVVLDVPLLFETNSQGDCDLVIVVTAPAFLQRQRALARPGMDDEKLKAILSRQIPDTEKRSFADAVVPSGLGKAQTLRSLKKALRLI